MKKTIEIEVDGEREEIIVESPSFEDMLLKMMKGSLYKVIIPKEKRKPSFQKINKENIDDNTPQNNNYYVAYFGKKEQAEEFLNIWKTLVDIGIQDDKDEMLSLMKKTVLLSKLLWNPTKKWWNKFYEKEDR